MTTRPRYRIVGLAVAVLGLVGLAACTDDPPASPPAGQSSSASTSPGAGSERDGAATYDDVVYDPSGLRFGLVGVESTDPGAASPAVLSQLLLADLLYDTLTVIGPAGDPRPGLATFTPNDDLDVWIFELRDGATFSDGSAITAADVAYSLNRLRSRTPVTLTQIQLENVTRIQAVGAFTVEVVLREPSAVLPELLASPVFGIVRQDAIEAAAVGGLPLASGSYAVTAATPSGLVLGRRLDDDVPESIHVATFADDGAAYNAFIAGALDWSPVPAGDLGSAIEAYGFEAVQPLSGTALLAVNPRAGALADGRLREAIALAIDRATLADAVFGLGAAPLVDLVPRGVPGTRERCPVRCGPNPERAAALVAEVFPDGQPAPVRLLVQGTPTDERIANVLVEQLEAVGIDAVYTAVDDTTYETLVIGGRQQLFLWATIGVARTPAVHLAEQYRSGSLGNVLGLESGAIDALVDAALVEANPVVRRSAWQKVADAVLERSVSIPLVQFNMLAVQTERARGLRIRVDGTADLAAVDLG